MAIVYSAGDNPVVAHVLELLGQAVALFISTDLDDVLVLLIFFADPRLSVRRIAAGQFIGIAALYCVSVIGSWVALIMPASLIGLLGLVPITMGLKGGWNLWSSSTVRPAAAEALAEGTGMGAVVAMTIANGADNISVYVPLFALRSALDIALIGIVFAVMTAFWLYLAFWLTRHRKIGAPVRRYTRLVMPFVFLALGVFILYQAGTLRMLYGFIR